MIHAMWAIPSTFHQCVKFPYNGIEIVIHGDLDSFQHCNHLKASVDNQIQSTLNHLQGYQNRITRRNNNRVRPKKIYVGDLVLKENQRNLAKRDKPGKSEPNWLAPFIIRRVIGNNTYYLATMEGDPLPNPMNSMHLKRYYI